MGKYLLAEKISASADSVVYRMRPGDRDDPSLVQDVRIPIDSSGEYQKGSDVTTTSGVELNGWSRDMLGKLLNDVRKTGEWPNRASLQS